MASVEKFLFFIGYGRSGHSIVASIMDAHPNVIIAHEYYLFNKLARKHQKRLQTREDLFDELYHSSYSSALSGWRAARETSKGYNLNLNGTWQGQFERLKVIGDKTGGATAMVYHQSQELFKEIIKKLWLLSGVPLYMVHVVRNPYDMVATVALYQSTKDPNHLKSNATVENKFNSTSYMELAANIVLSKVKAVQGISQSYKGIILLLEIHLEDLIKTPTKEIHRMCHFLEVPCPPEYVTACQNKVYRHASRSRDLVVWPWEIKQQIEDAISKYKFLNRYSFQN